MASYEEKVTRLRRQNAQKLSQKKQEIDHKYQCQFDKEHEKVIADCRKAYQDEVAKRDRELKQWCDENIRVLQQQFNYTPCPMYFYQVRLVQERNNHMARNYWTQIEISNRQMGMMEANRIRNRLDQLCRNEKNLADKEAQSELQLAIDQLSRENETDLEDRKFKELQTLRQSRGF